MYEWENELLAVGKGIFREHFCQTNAKSVDTTSALSIKPLSLSFPFQIKANVERKEGLGIGIESLSELNLSFTTKHVGWAKRTRAGSWNGKSSNWIYNKDVTRGFYSFMLSWVWVHERKENFLPFSSVSLSWLEIFLHVGWGGSGNVIKIIFRVFLVKLHISNESSFWNCFKIEHPAITLDELIFSSRL